MTEIEQTKRLEGRVAQILNAREIVINVGSVHGVCRAMKFAVLAEEPMKIIDPATNEVLDVIDREKVRVEAAEVRERITICRTYRTRVVGGRSGMFSSYLKQFIDMQEQYTYEPPRTVVETLRVEDSQLPPPLDPEKSYVKVNDRVILVEESSVDTKGVAHGRPNSA
jgi:hypothetical protein